MGYEDEITDKVERAANKYVEDYLDVPEYCWMTERTLKRLAQELKPKEKEFKTFDATAPKSAGTLYFKIDNTMVDGEVRVTGARKHAESG